MAWNKLGLVIQPDPAVWWMSHYTGPSFVEVGSGGILKIYVTGRDAANVSRIGIVEVSVNNPMEILRVHSQPVFDVGALGCFDESGVSYPWLVHSEGKIYMYYVGWVAGGKTRFQNATGLAISEDSGQSFSRVSRAPILQRTNEEPIGTGSVCVVRESNLWRMWYTCFVEWANGAGAAQHYYHIRYAESRNGIDWVRTGHVAIDFENVAEHTIGKPMVIKDLDGYKMWYSYRGGRDSYRIGFASSSDGLTWNRNDSQAGIDVSESGWDSEMVEYAFVFSAGGERYMVYNGNQFGQSGLGLARWSR
jgi:hypothetical protein